MQYDENGNLIVDTTDTGAVSDTSSGWASQIPNLVAGINAFELSQINLERARQGLPPLSAQAYGPQVSVGLSSQTIMLIVLAIGALFVLKR